jgi:hypothetical protein
MHGDYQTGGAKGIGITEGKNTGLAGFIPVILPQIEPAADHFKPALRFRVRDLNKTGRSGV